ncbi:hypothetical protein KVR01_012187 [Diaporthe batatas]|uniref:uncharacterized protein n=1 Tax=Diaporthe batatas TaxID=748121 RepID=UPI001D038279|nr:uncharacterized protein KVR01_012187 [Diaporthe batatas]KAG8157915.1 hypothetical protein KVR01_012187 [Diaporthe batatas]
MDSHTISTTTESSPTIPAKCISLPAEVWLLIFSVGRLDRHGDFWSTYDHPTMAKICRCCTLFRDLIRPRLYCNFESIMFTGVWHRFSVEKFARTVCENPRLAGMVRRVDIRGLCRMDELFGPARVLSAGDPDHDLALILVQKAAELGIGLQPYLSYRDDSMRDYVGFDLTALVLAQLPMLHTIRLHWYYGPPPDTVRVNPSLAGMPKPTSGWPWTSSIRNMALMYCGRPEPVYDHGPAGRPRPHPPGDGSFGSALSLLDSGSSLTRLSLVHINGPQPIFPLSNLLEVTLRGCRSYDFGLVNLLKRCSRLRKFVYGASTWEAHHLRPSPRDVIKALEPAQETLETLAIDFHGGGQVWDRARIQSLKQFTALKTLYIDMNTLWDSDAARDMHHLPNQDVLLTTVLPDSVEDLALFCFDACELLELRIEAHLRRLAIDRREKGAFPCLGTLRGKGLSPHMYRWQDEDHNRVAVFDEAIDLLRDDGVDVILNDPGCWGPEFSDIMTFR